jgi:hypothetical protein
MRPLALLAVPLLGLAATGCMGEKAASPSSAPAYSDKGPLGERGQALPPPAEGAGGACNPDEAKPFIGKRGTDVADQARVAADAESVRLIKPGQAVTMDFRTDRLNLKLDDMGIVTAVTCG